MMVSCELHSNFRIHSSRLSSTNSACTFVRRQTSRNSSARSLLCPYCGSTTGYGKLDLRRISTVLCCGYVGFTDWIVPLQSLAHTWRAVSRSSLLKSGRKMWRGEQEQGRLPGRVESNHTSYTISFMSLKYVKRGNKHSKLKRIFPLTTPPSALSGRLSDCTPGQVARLYLRGPEI